MSLIAKSCAESKFYIGMDNGDVFEEGADGIFVLKRIDGRKRRIPMGEIPENAQLLFGNVHRIWEYVR